jgi:hypothetical protein
MAYTALQLITRAYYLSGVVSREFQVPSPPEVEDGLYLLNALLDVKGSDLRLIPYYQYHTFNTVIGQEMYTIPNLLAVDTMTFNLGPVRYSIRECTRGEYFATARVDNINSLPFQYRIERQLDSANVYLYFWPSQVFVMNLWAKFGLTDVALTTDLLTIYDTYYIEYLRYALAEYICCEFGQSFPDVCMRKFDEIREKLMDISPADLSIGKRSYFNHGVSYDWQTVNLTTGYTNPG